MFGRLVDISTREEIAVYDKMLGERPEYGFANEYREGLKLLLQNGQDLQGEDRTVMESPLKTGLAWMMALARSELGATLSMYSNVETPFASVLTNEFGWDEYAEVLKHDAVAHMNAIRNEPRLRKALKPTHLIDSWSIAYWRRLKLINTMLDAIAHTDNEAFVSTVKRYSKKLVQHKTTIYNNIYVWTQKVTYLFTG